MVTIVPLRYTLIDFSRARAKVISRLKELPYLLGETTGSLKIPVDAIAPVGPIMQIFALVH